MNFIQNILELTTVIVEYNFHHRNDDNSAYPQWTRDGFGLGDTRALIGYTRYRLVGSDDESKQMTTTNGDGDDDDDDRLH